MIANLSNDPRPGGRPDGGLSDADLASIQARLPVGGLFIAHAHTDMTRLLAEVHRLRHALTNPPHPATSNGGHAHVEQGANR